MSQRWVNESPRMKEFAATNVWGVVMSSFYRIVPRGASAQPGSGQRSAASSRQRQKPELEKTLARLRSAGRLPDKRGKAWAATGSGQNELYAVGDYGREIGRVRCK